jgi:LmbE family N-acetylglucosaminyl deacetylase
VFGKRVLVLVPHPDDEVVGCAAAIGRAQAEGSQIFALYVTHGCIARDVMWPWDRGRYEALVARRRAEAEQVAQFLNIKPVGWSSLSARHLWREMDVVYAEIRAAITAHAIDQVWVPAYEGGNPDHDALNAIGQKLLQSSPLEGEDAKSWACNSKPLDFAGEGVIPQEEAPSPAKAKDLLRKSELSLPRPQGGRKLTILEFAEYNFKDAKAQAQTFPQPNGSEIVINLTDAERHKKRAALAMYISEKSNLGYVGVARECYRPLAEYDYAILPHAGKLWYARFQWVPFRHPRVDFTDPREVSAAIGQFLQKR